ncbi:MAG: hypothetical protein QS748_10255 [Candidatus Endonucleobacter bathymodioli]|uniref:Uncharacterized protein n=1 Tax=Candidatus Endonucleibacter bathymodioli TaxID=539814 RepID=A0AA90NMI7_9GAMM|nr:hypothetical protein [Candidatus Endonucleobacter bathymodioli]
MIGVVTGMIKVPKLVTGRAVFNEVHGIIGGHYTRGDIAAVVVTSGTAMNIYSPYNGACIKILLKYSNEAIKGEHIMKLDIDA